MFGRLACQSIGASSPVLLAGASWTLILSTAIERKRKCA